MMQTNHNNLVKQLHKTKKNGHPRNYELDSMNPHRSYSVCAWSLENTADQEQKAYHLCPYCQARSARVSRAQGTPEPLSRITPMH